MNDKEVFDFIQKIYAELCIEENLGGDNPTEDILRVDLLKPLLIKVETKNGFMSFVSDLIYFYPKDERSICICIDNIDVFFEKLDNIIDIDFEVVDYGRYLKAKQEAREFCIY